MLDDFRDDEINNSSEFLSEFRQRLNSQPLDDVEEHRAVVGRSQQIFLSAVLGIGLAGLVSWFIFSPEYSQIENTEIPVVRRPQMAIKIQPTEPGGMEILNQDKTVYDIVESRDRNEEKVENLLPPPEEPVLPMIQAEESESVEGVSLAVEEKDNATKQVEVVEEVKEEVKTVQKDSEKEVKTVEVAVKEEVKKENKAVEVKKEERPKEQVAQSIPNGVWQIQLMSSPNSAAIDKAWQDLKVKYPALKPLPREIEKADLGGKGMFYRLKAGAFSDRAEADKLCNSIKNSGGTCLVKKK